MKTGAFVCSCGESCDVDLEGVREGVDEVDVVASSELLCEDGLPAMAEVVDEYDLDQLVVTAAEDRCKRRFRDLAVEKGLHPEAAAFVDHREGAGWVHDEPAATEKTARLLDARVAGLEEGAVSRSVSREAGESVAVVGDPGTAAALADTADVTLVAQGRELADVDADLDDVTVERGRVGDVDGRYGDFELVLESRVTDDCIGCMDCVRRGPDEGVTRRPVDVTPEAADEASGEEAWVECCPTDAIDLAGVERTIAADQVVYPDADPETRGGRLGFYTGPVDAGTVAAVEDLLGGVEKPKHLDLDMDVCASGESSQMGCNECVEACPHGAVERPRIDDVAFDEVACQDCGACTSACPTGATWLREPSNRRIAREVEALLEPPESGGWLFGGSDPIGEQVVAFVCSERAGRALRRYGRDATADGEDFEYHPMLPVSVSCADTVGEAHAMHALAAGADGVAVVGCGGDCRHSGPDPKADLVERVNRATADLGLGERAAFLAPEPGDPEGFADALDAFVGSLAESPVPAGDHEATGEIPGEDRTNPAFDNHAWALESVRAILEHADPEREVIRGLSDFGRMAVSDDCALTPTCTNLCPTDAVRRREGNLEFNHQRCVDCGLCEEGCPETAITMRDGLDLSLLPENRGEVAGADGEPDDPAWTTVMAGEMRECVRCGDPFASEASAAKIEGEVGGMVAGLAPDSEHSVFEYCGDCRAGLLFEGGG
ncbi:MULTISPECIES: hydrogenase iron-sulfur subunit [Halorussus]|uniref:4Fe-4S dicluster domain-containing protein n=1 Tax=Halorussus TaxID=1070314 RepID=UPI000E2135DE|nr:MULTISPECIES: hydrogenase iron-sulfur subunit [Halorussus]NHN58692.1 hydrogenase iron-sulfur subunit [Halorussus sp. JP-T4]